MNTPPSFDDERFTISKRRIIFFDYVDFGLWNFVLESTFVPTHFVNNKVVDKPNYMQNVEEKRKV